MGYQRGAHVDGEDICKHFKFQVPGGRNSDGSPLYGWNDVRANYCARCGLYDTDHVLLKDTSEVNEKTKDSKKSAAMQQPAAQAPPRPPVKRPDANEGSLAKSALHVYELEPGIADPLAAAAYSAAKREQEQELKARQEAERAQAEWVCLRPWPAHLSPDLSSFHVSLTAGDCAQAAYQANKQASTPPPVSQEARAPERSVAEQERDKNARFLLEVEAMVKAGRAQPPESAPKLAEAEPPPPQTTAAPANVAELLAQLKLSQYIERFEEEGIELSVLMTLARGEPSSMPLTTGLPLTLLNETVPYACCTADRKDALDEALKEAGVASVGHRLKILAALQ